MEAWATRASAKPDASSCSDRLQRLTDDHLKAIFGAARVNLMTKDDDDPKGSTVEGWVAAFKDKVRQIGERTCAP